MVSYPYLPTTLDTLNDSKENCTKYQQYSNPEPLHTFPIVKPPLFDRSWTRIIEMLLQDNKSIMPVIEMVDLTPLELELAAFHSTQIKLKLRMLLSIPLSRLSVMRWKK